MASIVEFIGRLHPLVLKERLFYRLLMHQLFQVDPRIPLALLAISDNPVRGNALKDWFLQDYRFGSVLIPTHLIP